MKIGRACLAGLIGTVAMTVLMWALPEVGLPRLAIGEMLGSFMALTVGYTGIGPTVGWVLHFLFGIVLALVYARFVVQRLSGPPIARGLLYGVLVFCLAQIVFMPLVGAGFFSRGDIAMLFGNLLGHLVYGFHVGAIYRTA